MMIYIYMHIANMLHEIHTYVIANIYKAKANKSCDEINR